MGTEAGALKKARDIKAKIKALTETKRGQGDNAEGDKCYWCARVSRASVFARTAWPHRSVAHAAVSPARAPRALWTPLRRAACRHRHARRHSRRSGGVCPACCAIVPSCLTPIVLLPPFMQIAGA